MKSHSKIAQFNWECIGRFRSRVTISYRRQAITPDIFIRTYSAFYVGKIRKSDLNFRVPSFFRPNNSGVWLAVRFLCRIRSSLKPATEIPSVARDVRNAKRKGRIRPEDTGFGLYPVQKVWQRTHLLHYLMSQFPSVCSSWKWTPRCLEFLQMIIRTVPWNVAQLLAVPSYSTFTFMLYWLRFPYWLVFNLFTILYGLYVYFCCVGIILWLVVYFMLVWSLSFLIKIPMFMVHLVKIRMFVVHLWLPRAHVEAPVSGSIILSAQTHWAGYCRGNTWVRGVILRNKVVACVILSGRVTAM